jgi:hypothetical protein
LIPIMAKVEDGWECQRCRFICCGHKDATTHLREHGVLDDHVITASDTGDIYDLKDIELPDIIREGGSA